MQGKIIVVWFSCGAASAVAAKKTIEKYGQDNIVIVANNPIREEDEDNHRFLIDVENWLETRVVSVSNSKYSSNSCVDVWEQRRYMGGIAGAPCTLELKKKARYEWEANNHSDHHVLGFTADEKHRHDRFIVSERPIIPVLIDEGITKADCFSILRQAGIRLPRVYELGYPNANCIGCVKATSPTYWNHVRKCHPDVFAERARQSADIGAKLVRVKGERILLKDLHPDAKGSALKNMDFECGVFCEEKPNT